MKNYLKEVVRAFKKDWPIVLASLFVLGIVFVIDSLLGGVASGIGIASAGGAVYRNSQVIDGASWERLFGVSLAYAAKLENATVMEADNNEKVLVWYNSVDTFATDKANYNGLPVGSKVVDIIAGKEYLHQTAITWKSITYA